LAIIVSAPASTKSWSPAIERLEGGNNILCSPDFEERDFDAERASHGLNLAHLQHGLGKAKHFRCAL
jgi:hypothetical protein